MIKNFILFLVAFLLFLPISLVNLIVVISNGSGAIYKRLGNYFLSSALSIDKFANVEFRTLWRKTLIAKKHSNNYFDFGDFRHTISYVLGKNKAIGTLSIFGKTLVFILHLIDKNHVEKAVKSTETKLNK